MRKGQPSEFDPCCLADTQNQIRHCIQAITYLQDLADRILFASSIRQDFHQAHTEQARMRMQTGLTGLRHSMINPIGTAN